MTTQFTGKYVSLTTFRRDGTAVSTPVWFVPENGSLLVETDGNSYKVKRIRRNDNVSVASCNATGHVTETSFQGEPRSCQLTSSRV
jgi:uncharacterized protein